MYSNVIEAAYRYHDMMLATWLSLVGPGTTIVLLSDHGFHPDHLRLQQIPSEPAAPAAEHRELGILVIAGPEIKRDERIYGANLLDICPTLLALAGLPVADDMDGVPLLEAWREPPQIERIASWEDVPGDSGQHPSDTKLDPRESQQAIEQLVELGYIEKPDEDVQTAIRQVLRELQYNLAQSYMDADRHADAVEILEQLCTESPDDNRFALRLALCYRALDEIAKLEPLIDQMAAASGAKCEKSARELVELARAIMQRQRATNGDSSTLSVADKEFVAAAVEKLPLSEVIAVGTDEEKQQIHKLVADAKHNPYSFDYLRGYVQLAKGETGSALEHFRRAEQAEPHRPWLPIQIGEALLQLKQWEDAERSFRRALACDNENAYAFAGMARSYLGRKMYSEAADAALSAVAILHHFAFAHYLLGISLYRLGRTERAVQALELAVAINPNFAEAHRRLAHIAAHAWGDDDKARKHRRLARRGYARARGNRPNVLPKPIVGIANNLSTSRQNTQQASAAIHNRLALRPNIDPRNFVTVVTGLPRSGTSMLMQMLDAGGLRPLSDGLRAPDDDNPRGYYEFELVKRLQKDSSWLPEARGKAVKIVAQLLPNLPHFNYRLIFMDRDLGEVVNSQRQMLERNGRRGASLDDDQLRQVYAKQLSALGKILQQSRVPVLRINHRQCIEAPATVAAEINRFLGEKLDCAAMAGVVDRSLYRQRIESTCEMTM